VTTKSTSGDTGPRRERTASVSYPYHPLALCIDIGTAVREIGNGKADVSKSMLAHRLKTSEQSGDFASKLASTKTYGIIEGKGSFSLTAAAKTYFFPTKNPEIEKQQALLTFFSSPGAFRELIRMYDGSQLSPEIMANVLHQQMGIPDSWTGRVSKFFVRSAEQAGAMDSGHLRYKAICERLAYAIPSSSHETNDQQIHKETKSTPFENLKDPAREIDPGTVVWSYPCEGNEVRVETPQNLTKEVWEKLKRYIDVLEP
jgi:hypothetical protein